MECAIRPVTEPAAGRLIYHELDPEELRELAPTIPFELVEEFMFVDNATEITDRISGYVDNGLEQVILGDVTGVVGGLDEINTNAGQLQSLVAALRQLTPAIPGR